MFMCRTFRFFLKIIPSSFKNLKNFQYFEAIFHSYCSSINNTQLPEFQNVVHFVLNCMSKKKWPVLYINILYKIFHFTVFQGGGISCNLVNKRFVFLNYHTHKPPLSIRLNELIVIIYISSLWGSLADNNNFFVQCTSDI